MSLEVQTRGVDLEARHQEIRKLILSFLRFKNQELEDLIQDCYLLILIRNGTPGEHDPSKGSFSNYVRMALKTVASQRRNYGKALKRGGKGLGTIDHEPVHHEECDSSTPVVSPWTSDSGMRPLYIQELQARETCPEDLKEYMALLSITTESETLQEALGLETAQMRALRRRLTWWLRQEGELSDESLL